MKRIAMLILLGILFISGCSKDIDHQTINSEEADQAGLTVIATLFPQYDFAKQIGGDLVDVTLLLPPGIEAHSYEPTPKDMAKIQGADVLLYTGDQMEPWVSDLVGGLSDAKVAVVDVSQGVTLLSSDEEAHDSSADEANSVDAHEHGEDDPHIWLDPMNAKLMVQDILTAFIAADPTHEAEYTENAAVYMKKLDQLDQDFQALFDSTDNHTIIYGGHFAFAYFAKRYSLDYISPYKGFSPDAEPTPQSIAQLIDAINETNTKVIYYEELISPKVAEVIASETGARMLLLHGAHNVSKDELESNETYIDIMYGNMERLKEGLVDGQAH